MRLVVQIDPAILDSSPPISRSGPIHLYCDAEQSSFEEVGGVCPNKDNPEIPCLTIRSVTLGTAFVIGMSVLHMWLYSSPAAPLIHPVLVILVAHALGKLWSWIPWEKINGGPWTVKEHTVVVIMGNIAWMFFQVYSFLTITYLQYRERQKDFKFEYSFFIIIALQFLGFGLAGILRRVLVWSSAAVWPTNLPEIALIRTLHEKSNQNRSVPKDVKQSLWEKFIGNYRVFFFVLTLIQFVYCWFPYLIMPVLAAFSWMCMIKPTNYLLSQLTGHYGLGMGSFAFNWLDLTWTLGSPLVVPRWSAINIAVGFVLATWIITPIVYFSNVWDTYDRPVAEVTRSSSNWSALGLVSTAAALANLSAVIVHLLLHNAKSMWQELRTRSLDKKGNDVHCRLMAMYPDVPDWWFGICTILAFIVIVVLGHVSTIIRWYETFFAIFVPVILVLPFGAIASITAQSSQNSSVFYLLVIIATSLWVNDKSTMLAFVTIGYSLFCQTLQLLTNMKLGHYMKIAPRTLFLVQIIACLVTPSLSVGIQYHYFREGGFISNKNISLGATGSFQATSVGAAIDEQVHFFGTTNLKNRNLLYTLLIGAVLPIPFWYASRRWKWCRLIHIPLMLTFISWMSIVAAGSMFTWVLISLLVTSFFNKVCWKRHIYLASAALYTGFYLSWLIIAGPLVQYGVRFPEWWGFGGSNFDGCPLTLPNGTAFYVSFQN